EGGRCCRAGGRGGAGGKRGGGGAEPIPRRNVRDGILRETHDDAAVGGDCVREEELPAAEADAGPGRRRVEILETVARRPAERDRETSGRRWRRGADDDAAIRGDARRGGPVAAQITEVLHAGRGPPERMEPADEARQPDD